MSFSWYNMVEGSFISLNIHLLIYILVTLILLIYSFLRKVLVFSSLALSSCHQRSLYNAWVSTSKLQRSVKSKRIELQMLRHNLKLYSILKEQVRIFSLSCALSLVEFQCLINVLLHLLLRFLLYWILFMLFLDFYVMGSNCRYFDVIEYNHMQLFQFFLM